MTDIAVYESNLSNTDTGGTIKGVHIVLIFLIPRKARFIILSHAKRACITRASQGQHDFLLAINLLSLVGVRLDVIQSSDVKVHYWFLGNQLPSMTELQVLFMKRVFSYVNYKNVYGW